MEIVKTNETYQISDMKAEKGWKMTGTVTKDTIAGNIEYLLQNQIAFNSLKQNALKIRKEYPLDVIYKTIASCPPADYSKIIFASTKKQVIHNVHTKRKEAIKAQKQNSDK